MPKVLLIEDDPDQIQLYEMAFEDSGLQLITAGSGKQGLELVQTKPNLVLCDIILGDKQGIEVLKQIKRNSKLKKIPVVMLTNLTKKHVVEAALKAGAEDFWDKTIVMPFQVVSKVKDILHDA